MSEGESQPQLDRWRGSFGDEYIARNADVPALLRVRLAMWARILEPLAGSHPRSILEVGANIGANLRALAQLTGAELYAIEPNDRAREVIVAERLVKATNLRGGSADEIALPDSSVDLAFTCGVLIHVDPGKLEASCREIHRIARRYIVCIEYFSENPQTIAYRGYNDMLFLRDFGGLYLDMFPDLKIVDYGFIWKRVTGHDNLTWQIFEKPTGI